MSWVLCYYRGFCVLSLFLISLYVLRLNSILCVRYLQVGERLIHKSNTKQKDET